MSSEAPKTGFLEEYRRSHIHPVNRALHSIGIPMIVVSVPLVFFSWRWALALFALGWVFQFVGHFFEGKPPAFFKDPKYLFVGVAWWFRKVTGREQQR